jgi:hypothetical protein
MTSHIDVMSVSLVLTMVAAPSDGSDCAICLDNEARTAVWKETACRHSFHESCLEKWLIMQAQRLAAVGDLEAALQKARAAVELTSAALAGDSLRRLTV